MSIRYLAVYLFNFITKQNFQAKQPWVKWLIKRLSIINCHAWTASRFFGCPATLVASYLHPIIGLVMFILFALTDWVDGKVAAIKKKNGKFGALLDGTADKIFVIPLIGIWGSDFANEIIFWVLAVIDFGGNPVLALLNKYVFKKKNIFEHSKVGKWKFAFQVILVVILWHAKYYSPAWDHWPILIYCFTSAVIGFAIASVISKIKNE